MPTSGKIYLESCAFIDLAKTQRGVKLDPERENQTWFAGQILRAGREKDLLVYTSILTMIECIHIDQEYSPEVQRIFRGLLSGASGVIPIQPEIFVAERARELRWTHKIHLKPLDSLHVASAIEVGCTEIVTTDGKILTRLKAGQLNGKNLGIRAILASETNLLPDKYRQQKLRPSD
jgi:predicted nucleic acid-binding protein